MLKCLEKNRQWDRIKEASHVRDYPQTGRMTDNARRLATKASWRSLRGMNSSNWPSNRLLLALPSRDLKRLMPELEQIRCQREQILGGRCLCERQRH